MTNIWDFINEDNLRKMTKEELIDFWSLLISDCNRIDVIDRIKKVLDEKLIKSC